MAGPIVDGLSESTSAIIMTTPARRSIPARPLDALAVPGERPPPCGRVAVVNGGGGHQCDPGVAVGVVVPVEEPAAVLARLFDRVESGRELGPVLQRFEVRLGVGVVAGGVRA